MSSTMKGMTRCSVGRVYRAVPSSSLSLVLGQLESVQISEEEQESRKEEGEEEKGLGEKWLHPHCRFRWRTQGMGHGP